MSDSKCSIQNGTLIALLGERGKLYVLTNKGAGVETHGCAVFLGGGGIEGRKYKENINTNKDEDKKELENEKEKRRVGSEKKEKEEV